MSYKYRPQPDFTNKPMNNTSSIPTILDEIFAPFLTETHTRNYVGSASSDQSKYTLAVEIPRLIKDTISVEVEPTSTQYKTMAYKVVIKAGQDLLTNYLDSSTESAKKRYEQEITILGQNVALDGSLALSYTEGVLCIEIPLCKPVQPKKATLSARLSDM
jgi:HSP20 family molecular chaperone IbpA